MEERKGECVFMGGGRGSQSASKWDALQAMSSEPELQSITTELYDGWYGRSCALNGSRSFYSCKILNLQKSK